MTERVREGWRRVKFGEVVRQVKDVVDPAKEGIERFVAGEHMDTDDLTLRRWGKVGEGYLGPAFHMRFRKGQVLYGSRRTYLRKVAVAPFDGICANTTFVMEPRDSDLLPEFLPYVLQSDAFANHSVKQSRGSVNPYVNFSDLSWFEFDLPPREEQRRLYEVLAAGRSLSEALSVAWDAANQLLHVTIAKFNAEAESNQQSIRCRIDEAGDVQLGQQRHPAFRSGTNVRPYLRVANVFDGTIDTNDIERMHFPVDALPKFELKEGDILLNEGQSKELVGRSAIFRGEIEGCCFQKTLIRFRCGSGLLPAYAHAVFRHYLYSRVFESVALKTTSIAHLTSVRFAAMPIVIPPLELQKTSVRVLREIEDARDRIGLRLKSSRVYTQKVINLTTEE